jgi:predicted  nucleic acid-binding Zn-ribbon protein
MWPFTKSRPADDLTQRVEKLEREQKALRSDWEEWYEKYARLNQRIAKRLKDAMKADEAFENAEPKHTNASGPTNGRRITNPLAQEILRGRIHNGE